MDGKSNLPSALPSDQIQKSQDKPLRSSTSPVSEVPSSSQRTETSDSSSAVPKTELPSSQKPSNVSSSSGHTSKNTSFASQRTHFSRSDAPSPESEGLQAGASFSRSDAPSPESGSFQSQRSGLSRSGMLESEGVEERDFRSEESGAPTSSTASRSSSSTRRSKQGIKSEAFI
ncbi:hypothetical protein HYFRA_00006062 [Hymenoscyphus fraxineus]|uniref:Uncharacterized protein n=1 Tax=Hymenoscyphus fraxineus TaxID=746836 RepID=A0A9N9KYH8_9HELO|nr:hypothetical protein HYFRA_00006062 [Hymenoscyphus fraxineus]